MSEMQVRCGWVHPELYAQWTVLSKFRVELGWGDYFGGMSRQVGSLFFRFVIVERQAVFLPRKLIGS